MLVVGCVKHLRNFRGEAEGNTHVRNRAVLRTCIPSDVGSSPSNEPFNKPWAEAGRSLAAVSPPLCVLVCSLHRHSTQRHTDSHLGIPIRYVGDVAHAHKLDRTTVRLELPAHGLYDGVVADEAAAALLVHGER